MDTDVAQHARIGPSDLKSLGRYGIAAPNGAPEDCAHSEIALARKSLTP